MIVQANALHIPLADESVQMVCTSPPYWGLRDYGLEPTVWGSPEADCEHEWEGFIVEDKRHQWKSGHGGFQDRQVREGAHKRKSEQGVCRLCSAWLGCLGLEPTPELYVEHLVEIFREVRRALRPDGTVWLNLGDSYNAGRDGGWPGGKKQWKDDRYPPRSGANVQGLKPKDLVGIPWRVAFALQADGWWLRSDIVWAKPNPMPESVRDRPTRAHEYIFLLTKSARYFYDAEAIAEPPKQESMERLSRNDFSEFNPPGQSPHRGPNKNRKTDKQRGHSRRHDGLNNRWDQMTKAEQQALGRNKRSVWTIATEPYPGAHYATFPKKFVEPCVLAGSAPGDIVLDPFCGKGTTVEVAMGLGRFGVALDLATDLAAKETAEMQTGFAL